MISKGITRTSAVIVIVAIIVLAAVGGAIAYYYTLAQAPAAPTTIKIGFEAPLTGMAGYVGQEMLTAAQMAVEEINAKGGVLGKNLELVMGDDESKPEKGSAVIERMITVDKIVVIAGGYHSSVVLLATAISNRYGIPWVVTSAVALPITEAKLPTVFRICANSTAYGDIGAIFLRDKVKPRTYAVLGEESDYARSTIASFKASMAKYVPGAKLVAEEYAPMGATDYYAVLTKIAATNPDILNIMGTGVGIPLPVKQAYELKIPVLVMGAIEAVEDFVRLAGPEASEFYSYTQNFAMIQYSNKTMPFVEKYQMRTGRFPSYMEARQYDGIYVVADAIQRAGSADPAKIVEALKSMNYVGVRGLMTFDPVYHQWPEPILWCQLQKVDSTVKQVVVYPDSLAEAPFQWPPNVPRW